jgi:UDP-N-acetyl-D-galactosamine dehydrogenase
MDTVAVVGLGQVGYRVAIAFAEAGMSVIGLDVNTTVVDTINRGECPHDDHLLPRELSAGVREKFSAYHDATKVPWMDVHAVLLAVPTPVSHNKEPDVGIVRLAASSVLRNIPRGKALPIVLESTVFPGATRGLFRSLLTEFKLENGRDVIIAHCPERVNPGDSVNTVQTTSRVIGCDDAEVGDRLVEMYRRITTGQVLRVSSIEVAETSKVVENAQRAVNIAFVNELSRSLPLLGLDADEVLRASGTKWNFHKYKPGVGVGGHCIAVDPHFLVHCFSRAGVPPDLLTGALSINSSQPEYVGSTIVEYFNAVASAPKAARPTALVLGHTYKPNVGDYRAAPAEGLSTRLTSQGWHVIGHDPYAPASDFEAARSLSWISSITRSLDAATLAPLKIDIIILCVPHTEYFSLDWVALRAVVNTPLVFDAQRVLDTAAIKAAGFQVGALGKPVLDNPPSGFD